MKKKTTAQCTYKIKIALVEHKNYFKMHLKQKLLFRTCRECLNLSLNLEIGMSRVLNLIKNIAKYCKILTYDVWKSGQSKYRLARPDKRRILVIRNILYFKKMYSIVWRSERRPWHHVARGPPISSENSAAVIANRTRGPLPAVDGRGVPLHRSPWQKHMNTFLYSHTVSSHRSSLSDGPRCRHVRCVAVSNSCSLASEFRVSTILPHQPDAHGTASTLTPGSALICVTFTYLRIDYNQLVCVFVHLTVKHFMHFTFLKNLFSGYNFIYTGKKINSCLDSKWSQWYAHRLLWWRFLLQLSSLFRVE